MNIGVRLIADIVRERSVQIRMWDEMGLDSRMSYGWLSRRKTESQLSVNHLNWATLNTITSFNRVMHTEFGAVLAYLSQHLMLGERDESFSKSHIKKRTKKCTIELAPSSVERMIRINLPVNSECIKSCNNKGKV